MVRYPIFGGCLCGVARYRLAGPPLASGTCHCRSCRRAAGAEQVTWATARAADFAWETPPPAAYASSPGVERTFCPVCGTGLTYRDEAATIDVQVATLDEPEAVPPTRALAVAPDRVEPGQPGAARLRRGRGLTRATPRRRRLPGPQRARRRGLRRRGRCD
jgi:hypothetical protein